MNMTKEQTNIVKWRNQKNRFCQNNIFLVLVIVIVAQLASCTHHKIENVEPAFYYWKSNSYLSDNEQRICDSLDVKNFTLNSSR
jgi:hypothetical protein